MSTIAFDQFALTRIADFARIAVAAASGLAPRRRSTTTQIDREFNAVCMSVVGLHHRRLQRRSVLRPRTTPSSTAWTKRRRASSRAEQGYDLVDDQGMLTDWWGLLLDDPGREARLADAGKPRCGAGRDRGKISGRAERDRRDRRAVSAASSPG